MPVAGPYATPTDFWTISAPPVALFQDGRLARGLWSAVLRTAGTGLGSLLFDPSSNPRDSYSGRVRVTVAGEIPTPGEIAFVGLPTMQVSLDAGVSWGAAQVPDTMGRLPVMDAPAPIGLGKLGTPAYGGGFTLFLANGGPGAVVTFGAGNAALDVRAKRGGLSFRVISGNTLAVSLDPQKGLVTLTVSGSTTALAAAEHILYQGMPVQVAAGGNGSGAVQVAATQTLPFTAFSLDDVFSFSTQPSPDVLNVLLVESDYVAGILRNSNNPGAQGPMGDPVAAYGGALVGTVCDKARWRLIRKAGLASNDDMQNYRPTEADAWLAEMAGGRIQPTLQETGTHRSFAKLVEQVDPVKVGILI